VSNPAGTELEVVMMDWLGKMLQLPKEFLFSESDKGGGIIQVTKRFGFSVEPVHNKVISGF
ncbi:dopa decarboxylase, partial [Plakobranchus ocellatus]